MTPYEAITELHKQDRWITLSSPGTIKRVRDMAGCGLLEASRACTRFYLEKEVVNAETLDDRDWEKE